MEEILKQFELVNLFDGCSHLLHFLGVKHTQEMKNPITYADYAEGVIPQYVNNALRLAKSYYYIGEVCDESIKGTSLDTSLVEDIAKLREDSHYQSMMLFAVDLREDCSISRTDLSVLTRAFNRLVLNFPVTVFFRHGQYLSIGTCERSEYKQEWRQGEKLGRVSILRDINCRHPHRGHLDILKGLDCSECSTFDKVFEKWTKVFNSELLTKKFYNDLFEWYQWAVDPETKVTFPGDADVQNDDRENIDTRVIRLITRLMFVWFIKQKHLIPDCIFDIDHLKKILKDFDPLSTTEANYYQAILQNLFFGTLNRAIIEDGETRNFASNSKKDLTNLYRYGNGDKDGGLFAISDEEVIEMFANVPYLNCGLFECLDKTKTFDGVDRRYYNDGFSRNNQKFADGTYRYRAVVPNILFFEPEKGLISIFEKYVFTIEENTPQDVQVALDPELLGKVFENLLGAYNPETKETARNQSGSFYTPREIVQYMVNESLVAHLKRTVGAHLEAQFRDLLDFSTETVDLTDADKKAILHSLFTCKILDPACGSGAFPMGMLQQMVHILQQVDPDNTQWKEVLLDMAVDESRRAFGIVEEEERKKKLLEIEETFNNALNSPDYTRKLYIIESCIYGVDIQPIAMLITRLRFFITLICEQTDIKWDKPEENFGIKTLPNLESKFVAANSLIDADIHQYNEDWTKNEELVILKDELMAIRRRHFYTRKRNEKMRLLREDERKREQIHTLINKLVGEPNQEHIAELERVISESKALLPKYAREKWTEEMQQTDLFAPPTPVRIDVNKRQRDIINARIKKCEQDIERELHKCTPQGFEAAVLQVTDWNPYDQNSVSPFLDIEWMFGITDGFDIVIGNPPYVQLQGDSGKYAKLYESCGYETFARTGDMYCLFYERGWQNLKEGGHLCYITSNKWMRAGYGELTREFFGERTNPKLLIDFSGTKIFDSATVDTNILLFEKATNLGCTVCCVTKKLDKNGVSNLSLFVQQNNSICNFQTSDSWVILSPTEQSIKQKIEAVGTPLKDWDIQINYGIKTGFNDAFIITTEKRNQLLAACKTPDERKRTEELIRPILRGRDIKRYSYDWANLWLVNVHNGVKGKIAPVDINDYPTLKRYLDSYWSKISSRDDQGVTPYNLRNCAYLEDFDKPKIIFQEIVQESQFVYDNSEHFMCNDTCRIIVGGKLDFLLGILNSHLFFFAVKYYYGGGVLGEHGIRMKHTFFGQFPCIPVDEKITCLTTIQNSQCNDDIQKQIDLRIYELYGLSESEIEYIEQSS